MRSKKFFMGKGKESKTYLNFYLNVNDLKEIEADESGRIYLTAGTLKNTDENNNTHYIAIDKKHYGNNKG